MVLAEIAALAAAHGLVIRGAFHPDPADGVPRLRGGTPIATLVLVGFVGSGGWPKFAASPEARTGGKSTRPLVAAGRRRLAASLGGIALYPFGGPPFLPFQRWARRAEGSINRPWHADSSGVGALAQLPRRARLRATSHRAAAEPGPSPCASCAGRPCLSSCPVGAFTEAGYDFAACAAHIAAPAGEACIELGCRARSACPVGPAHRYGADQASFHMRAFHAAVTVRP